MEFKCLTNIETSFRQLRMYALVLLLLLYLWLLFATNMVPELEVGHPELLHLKP